MRLLKKIKRELSVMLSKVGLKNSSTNYLGLNLRFPLIYGMGRGYIIPAEFWMGQCLKAFLNIKQGSVVDIGANVGVYLVKLRVICSDTKYFGFEPNHVCNFYTQELVRLNNFKNTLFFPFALSNKNEIKTLYAEKLGDKSASIIKDTKLNTDTKYSFSIYTVVGDEFIDMLDVEDISVIKIDVEGAELEVLTGLHKTIAGNRPFLYCEVISNYVKGEVSDAKSRAQTIFNMFKQMDYSIFGVKQDESMDKLNSPDDFFADYAQEYIFSPNEHVEKFRNNVER